MHSFYPIFLDRKVKWSNHFFFLGKSSSRLCLDYIVVNLVIKIWLSETKPGHRMLVPGLEPKIDGIFYHISPKPFASTPPPL